MQLGYAILYVQDVPATLKFYEAAFGLTTRFLDEGGDYGELYTAPRVTIDGMVTPPTPLLLP